MRIARTALETFLADDHDQALQVERRQSHEVRTCRMLLAHFRSSNPLLSGH